MHWAKFYALCVLAAPAFLGTLGFPIAGRLQFGLVGLNDQVIYYALFFNLMLFLIVGHKQYVTILTLTILFSLTILIIGPVIRYFYQTPESYSAYYVEKFVNMLTVVPAALSIILSIPVNDLERKLFSPGANQRKWRKALIISIRVVRYVVFQVLPSMKEKVLEEAVPYRCVSEIWKRDRRAGRPANAILNSFLLITHFCGEVLLYALGASMKNVDLWANWISRVAAHIDTVATQESQA